MTVSHKNSTGDNNQPQSSFLYAIPKIPASLTSEACNTLQLSALASAQVTNVRTRVAHADGRLENVAEHSLMLAKVAPDLAAQLYPGLDQDLIARYATVHDDVEIYVGDTPTDILGAHNPKHKDEIEKNGLKQLLQEYRHIPSYCRIVQSYEAQDTAEARFVRAVDKLMVLLIHIPNSAVVLRHYYTRQSFLEAEAALLVRDRYKYAEFEKVIALRIEIGTYIASTYLPA